MTIINHCPVLRVALVSLVCLSYTLEAWRSVTEHRKQLRTSVQTGAESLGGPQSISELLVPYELAKVYYSDDLVFY
jgi:hypothetical protein